VKDPARRIVKDDVDGSADLDGLKAVFGKHSDNCNLVLDVEGHRRSGLQRTSLNFPKMAHIATT
jgi:hypothetical protein